MLRFLLGISQAIVQQNEQKPSRFFQFSSDYWLSYDNLVVDRIFNSFIVSLGPSYDNRIMFCKLDIRHNRS